MTELNIKGSLISFCVVSSRLKVILTGQSFCYLVFLLLLLLQYPHFLELKYLHNFRNSKIYFKHLFKKWANSRVSELSIFMYLILYFFCLHAWLSPCFSSFMGIQRPEGVMPCLVGKELPFHRTEHLLRQIPIPESQERGFWLDSTKCCQSYSNR